MREIKFRIWDSKRKEWVHGPGNEINLFGETILSGEISRRPDDSNATLEEFVTDFLPLQFTGLLDKNGKEIYEGDILYCKSISKQFPEEPRWIVRVVFEDASFCMGKGGDPLEKYECSVDMEIIGNVYSNPELIKELDYLDQ